MRLGGTTDAPFPGPIALVHLLPPPDCQRRGPFFTQKANHEQSNGNRSAMPRKRLGVGE